MSNISPEAKKIAQTRSEYMAENGLKKFRVKAEISDYIDVYAADENAAKEQARHEFSTDIDHQDVYCEFAQEVGDLGQNPEHVQRLIDSAGLETAQRVFALPKPVIGSVTFHCPLTDVIEAARDVSKGSLDCEVMFGNCEEGLGITVFPEDNSRPKVVVRPDQTIEQAMDILAHELAHVIRGLKEGVDDHCSEWESLYEQIHEAYIARVCPQDTEDCVVYTDSQPISPEQLVGKHDIEQFMNEIESGKYSSDWDGVEDPVAWVREMRGDL